jgi:hypothetical protein
MKEYMLYIRNEKEAKKSLTSEQHLAFIKQCESYIEKLKNSKQLIGAQPIVREGIVLKKLKNGWEEKDIQTEPSTQVGYYHIKANNFIEAINIAKGNPEFSFVPSASIEIREIKTKEFETGYTYPNQE